ncbi:MAG TPA: phosphoribosylamine--glycine ligase [Firmicutes bacterium]|jgi:phosphoribosylamine--glycine ligase|nr:phosphoribosylamine--glycine ligase [Bacillota bacterium]
MHVLLVGGGGREHALAWSISQSPLLTKLYAAPGNPGIAQLATCLPIAADDGAALVQAAKEHAIDLVVIGPEAPLASGLVDQMAEQGIAAFGPSRAAAQLESSKAWAKQFMAKYAIPTANYRAFQDYQEALKYVEACSFPLVIKASGLAAGKGAVIVYDLAEAEATLRSMLLEQSFGAAGAQVVIEDFLQGQEVTVLALVNGQDYLVLPVAQDHKAVFDGDRGPNTGGMGVYSPVPAFTSQLEQEVIRSILQPTLRGLQAEGIYYSGVLYMGLMLTEQGPKVIEYNVRFGDPETQVVLPRIENDVLELLAACSFQSTANLPNGVKRLTEQQLLVKEEACASVIMAAPGYPGDYPKGLPISGLEQAEATGCIVFQAGTKEQGAHLVSSGGRILAVTALGASLKEALERAYGGIARIHIPGAHYRRDIGHKALSCIK